MKRSEIFPSKYWKATDLAGPVRQTIKKVMTEQIGEDKESKAVLYGAEDDRGLPLNLTNYDTLAEQLGEETDNWPGSTIELFPTTAMFSGKKVPAIRVRVVATAPLVPADNV